MREDRGNLHTPKKEQPVSSNRTPKSINPQSKKLHHKSSKNSLNSVSNQVIEEDIVLKLPDKESIETIASISEAFDNIQSIADSSKRSLSSDFTPVSEDVVELQLPDESIGMPLISDAFIFDEDCSSQTTESYIMALNQFISPSSAATPGSMTMTPFSSTTLAETTPSSCVSTVETTPTPSILTAQKAESFEVEPLVTYLRQSMLQVSSSTDIDPQYKKLLDSLSKIVFKEFYSPHQETDWVVERFLKKVKVVIVLSFVLYILAVSAGFIFYSDGQSSYHGPPPT